MVSTACAQDSLRYYRLYISDKGTPHRIIPPNDPLYRTATAHLTGRALNRRLKMFPPDERVSTADLPIPQPYLDAILSTGAVIAQSSRWLNTVMVRTDSVTYRSLLTLPFLDSIRTVRTLPPSPSSPFDKVAVAKSAQEEIPERGGCITNRYGLTGYQNRLSRFDYAHTRGIAGEDILIGVLDGGFDWRSHLALRNADVIGERDFVYGDTSTYDEPGENPSEYHGTTVMSTIAGYLPGKFVGGAPSASFLLARTEDIRSERNVEEDNYVAGLEWLEAQGVDITNASLGYTSYDPPEKSHTYDELDGRTAFASRGLNHCVSLGVVCVNAAGNEFLSGFKFIGVPAEADSAIAVAAVDSHSVIASFSSRGFSGNGRLKPDIATMGVKVWGADSKDSIAFAAAQGTSLASPLATAGIALILSARPDLTPYEVRTLIQQTASHAENPDTAYGYGLLNVEEALRRLSRERPVVGYPAIHIANDNTVTVGAWVDNPLNGAPGMSIQEISDDMLAERRQLDITLTPLSGGSTPRSGRTLSPVSGIAQWTLAPTSAPLTGEDRVEVVIRSHNDGTVLRRTVIDLGSVRERVTVCEDVIPTITAIGQASPNPFREFTSIDFTVRQSSAVTLAVYNSLGEEVARLLDGDPRPAGRHTVLFIPNGLPSGAYYVMLDAGDQHESRSLIYLP